MVPLPFVHSGDMKMAFTHETNCFLMVLGCPRGPRRETAGVGGGICCLVAAQPRAFSQQIPREVLGRWKGGSISEDRKEGKREDGRLDLPLRLVAPEGPADIIYIYIYNYIII